MTLNIEELPFNTDLNQQEVDLLDMYRLGYEHGKKDYMPVDPTFESWEELEQYIINIGSTT